MCRYKISLLSVLILTLFLNVVSTAQDSTSVSKWDNQIYLGNKISYGKYDWRFSTELQTRMRNQMQTLDNWYIEQVATYLYSKHWEFVPDFRFTVKPDKLEFRPGLGALYKIKNNKLQFINQVKWQVDFSNHGAADNAFREVVFLNYKYNEKIVGTFVCGFIYRWREHWNGFQYIRVGPGISYIFDDKHILNFSYFTGVENNGKTVQWAGVPMIQFVINVNKSYKYTPAYYFSF